MPAVYALLFTVIGSPFVVRFYKRRIHALVQATAASAQRAWASAGSAATEVANPPAPRVSGFAAASADLASLQLIRRQERGTLIAHAGAGLCHALVAMMVYAAAWPMGSPWLWLALLVAFLVPTAVTAVYLARRRARWIAGLLILSALGVAAAPAHYPTLVALIVRLYVLVPLVVFLLSTPRYWRGVVPLMLVTTYVASVGCVGSAEVGRAVLGPESPLLWPLRIAGLLFGAWLGVRGLRRLGRHYRRHAVGDQELFIDSFWLVYTLTQTIILVVTRESWWLLVGLVAFPVYVAVKRALLRPVRELAPSRPARLLLLRVFNDDRRAEQLFDALADRWSLVGTISLIAGRDLATRTIGPADFIELASGALERRFIRAPEDLDQRMAELDDAQVDPDGHFRVEPFLCHDHTWQPVVRAMAEKADVVLMDLRGFDRERPGITYELRHLAANEPDKPLLLLFGDDAELARVQALFASDAAAPDGGGARWQIADARRGLSAEPLLHALLRATRTVEPSRKAAALDVPAGA